MQMNDDGYVPLDLIASFNKVAWIHPSAQELLDGVAQSKNAELSEDRSKIRAKYNPTEWVFPAEVWFFLFPVIFLF